MRQDRTAGARGLVAVLVAGGVALTGCSGGGSGTSASGSGSAPAAASVSASTPVPATTSPAPDTGGAPVRCSGSSCSLTLTGDATSVSVLGTRVSFGGVQDGRATLTVGDRTVSCAQGDSVSAGPLLLTCTTVQADRVTLTAGLGG